MNNITSCELVTLADSRPNADTAALLAARFAPIFHLASEDDRGGDPAAFIAASYLGWKHRVEHPGTRITPGSLDPGTALGERVPRDNPEFVWRHRYAAGNWTAPGQKRTDIHRWFSEATPQMPSGFYMARQGSLNLVGGRVAWFDVSALPDGSFDVAYWLFFPRSTPPDDIPVFIEHVTAEKIASARQRAKTRAENAIQAAGGDIATAARHLRIPRPHLDWARDALGGVLDVYRPRADQAIFFPKDLPGAVTRATHFGTRILAHQGDWEGVTVRVAPEHTAKLVFYNSHTSGEVTTYDDALGPDGRVHVWIAAGSHASYASPEAADQVGWGDRVCDDVRFDASGALQAAISEPWYGFGGGWGDACGSWMVTHLPLAEARNERFGPVGPCRYRRALDYVMHEGIRDRAGLAPESG